MLTQSKTKKNLATMLKTILPSLSRAVTIGDSSLWIHLLFITEHSTEKFYFIEMWNHIICCRSVAVYSFTDVARCCRWQLHFVHEKFVELQELHRNALPEDQKLLPWDLHVPSIKQVVYLLSLLGRPLRYLVVHGGLRFYFFFCLFFSGTLIANFQFFLAYVLD